VQVILPMASGGSSNAPTPPNVEETQTEESKPASAHVLMDGIAEILSNMSSKENHICTTAEVGTLELCFDMMKTMKTELDEYSRIVPTMAQRYEHLMLRCDQLDKELQDALNLNAMILEGREAETEQGNTVPQDDGSVALIQQLQEEYNKQVQSTAEGERLSHETAKQLDLDENHTVAKRVSSRQNRGGTRQQSSKTQETSATDMKPTKKRQKRKRLSDNDGINSVQMDVSKEDEDNLELQVTKDSEGSAVITVTIEQ
jgi:hypothetical protein